MKKKQVKITWYHFACVFNALTHMVKHARFNFAQAVDLHGKSLLPWCRMLHVRKSVKTSLCFKKLLLSDGTCQQKWSQGCTRESAATDTRGSLLSALRARYCYLTFSVTVATAILNVAMWKNCWQSSWLTDLLCRKSALRTKLVLQNQRESGRCGVGVLSWKEQIIIHVVPEIHVWHGTITVCWNDIYLLSEVLGMLMLLLLLLLVLLLILLLFLLLRIPFECYAQDRGVIYD